MAWLQRTWSLTYLAGLAFLRVLLQRRCRRRMQHEPAYYVLISSPDRARPSPVLHQIVKNPRQKVLGSFVPNPPRHPKLKVSRRSIGPTRVEASGDTFDTSSTPHGAKWESKKVPQGGLARLFPSCEPFVNSPKARDVDKSREPQSHSFQPTTATRGKKVFRFLL